MDLRVYRSHWGYAGSVEELASDLSGGSIYDGIEALLPADPDEQAALSRLATDAGLGLIPMILLEGRTPAEQLLDFRTRLGQAAALDPDRVVVHSGRDAWTLGETLDFYSAVVEIEAEIGQTAAHETHRGRPFGTPWVTVEAIEAHPELRLCCDFSHWVLVCERLLPDQGDAISKAAARALHVHARVGTDQAPQVADPAGPAAAVSLETFERWWGEIWDLQQKAGMQTSTATPEYGPPPYQPDGGDPDSMAARLAGACDWQCRRLRSRFQDRDQADHPAPVEG